MHKHGFQLGELSSVCTDTDTELETQWHRDWTHTTLAFPCISSTSHFENITSARRQFFGAPSHLNKGRCYKIKKEFKVTFHSMT